MNHDRPDVLCVDSVTAVTPAAAGRVVVAGSHGGLFAAAWAAACGLRGVILNDAGIGLDEAGIAGIAWLEQHGLPGAATSHLSARIGDAADMWARGRLSVVNRAAAALGCVVGQPVADAAGLMRKGGPIPVVACLSGEARVLLRPAPIPIWGLDSNSLVREADAGCVIITGSHGGLLGGRPETAVKAAVLAAVYNDAGIGVDRAGISRLPALAARGIAGATVSAATARIGEARSTWTQGVLSAVNAVAAQWGAAPGMTVPEFVACVTARPAE